MNVDLIIPIPTMTIITLEKEENLHLIIQPKTQTQIIVASKKLSKTVKINNN